MTSQPKTHMERMGFRDPEIGSPAHDRLVLWTQEHASEWLAAHIPTPDAQWAANRRSLMESTERMLLKKRQEVIDLRGDLEKEQARDPAPPDWKRDQRERARAELARIEAQVRRLEDVHVQEEAPAIEPAYRLELEYLLTGSRGYALGFLDLLATVTYPYYGWRPDYLYREFHDQDGHLQIEMPRIHNYTTPRKAAFEAKLTIPSLGELLRQLRFYRENLGRYEAEPEKNCGTISAWKPMPYVVVSPDTRYRAQIEDQGFLFWEAPKERYDD
jgi:hypothetical protein